MKVRKLAVALALAGGLGSGFAHALGMGEGRILTNLNEPLRAEIELVRPGEVSVEQINVSLATEEDFERAGVNKMHFLRQLDFEVVRGDQGQLMIEVTTDNPVREPFLNFLVDLTWPSGRMLREYSFLVDPPDRRPPDEPETPTAEAQPEPEPRPEPDPPAREPEREPERVYGPTAANDTLWTIAGQIAPSDDVSRQQVMLALQDLNPEAFIGGNINRLRQGHVLRIPTEEQARRRSMSEAVAEVMAQNEAMQAAAPDEALVDATDDEPTAPDPAAITDEPAPDEDELRIMVAEGEADDEGTLAGTGPGEAEGELAVALEELDRVERDRDELSERVDELEEQIGTMEQLIELKDDQLAEMQRRLEAAEAEPTVPEEPVEEEAPEVATAPEPEAPEPEEVAEPEPEPAPAEEDPEVAEEPAPEPAAEDEEAPALTLGGLFDRLRTDPLWQAGAGGIGIGLLALLWVLARRNAARERAFYDQIQDFSDEEDTDEDFLGLGDEQEVTDEADEQDLEGDEGTVGEQDDVIAEADVYMAYGRLDQAGQHLEDSISREPSRTDLRLKLLEVYAESGDGEAFDKQYRELAAMDDAEAVAEADQLRQKLGAEEELSIDDLAEQLKTGSSDEAAPADDQELAGSEESDEDMEEGLGLEWDLDEPSSPASEQAETPETGVASSEEDVDAGEEESDFDFSLDDLELEDDTASADTTAADESESEDLESLGLEEESAEEVPEVADTATEETVEDEDLDLELDTEDESLPTADDIAADDAGTESLKEEWDAEEDLLEPEQEQTEGPGEQEEAPSAAETDSSEFDDSFLDELDAELDKVTEEEQESGSGETPEPSELDDLELDVSQDDLALMDEVASGEDTDQAVAEETAGEEETVPETEEGAAAEEAGEEQEEALGDSDESLLDLEPEGETAGEEISGEESRALEEEEFPEHTEGGEWETESAEADEDLEAAAPTEDTGASETDAAETSQAEKPQAEVEDDEFDFLEGTDEAATKLDLARAYMEMGDADGARDILEEVAQEGNDQQKQEAQQLLADL